MTDKEIRALIEKRRKGWKYRNSVEAKYKAEECKDILELIDSSQEKPELSHSEVTKISDQEEPVSIWHDASEEPNDKSSCLIHYIVGGKVSYRDIFPVIYNKEVREFVSESYPHPTGYKVKQCSLEGGVVEEVYKDMRDRFPLSDIYKWAYVDDILNLSNVEITVKDWKEEPVSEELETEIEKYLNALYRNWTKKDREKDADVEEMCRQTARHFAQWQKERMTIDSIEATVKVDAGGYPYVDLEGIELYDYDKDIPLAKGGDKVKVIIIKEE